MVCHTGDSLMNHLIDQARLIPTPESALTIAHTHSAIRTRALVVCGDEDNPHFTSRGPDWHADAFQDAICTDRDLLILHGVGHGLGGIAGLDAKETDTESPDVLEALRRLSLAWLRTALGIDPAAWQASRTALERSLPPGSDSWSLAVWLSPLVDIAGLVGFDPSCHRQS